jgi:catechol 2,3-dioxygenase-like lactoylglutathione lyase family enzyme
MSLPEFKVGPFDIAPVFLVKDVVESAEYYRDFLGFHFDRYWGDPPDFVVLQRGGITIMLNSDEGKVQASNPNHRTNTDARWDAYLRVPSADVIHDEFRDRGVQIVRAIADAEYGFRDFEIEDLDGYILCIGSERCLDEALDKNS